MTVEARGQQSLPTKLSDAKGDLAWAQLSTGPSTEGTLPIVCVCRSQGGFPCATSALERISAKAFSAEQHIPATHF